MNYDVIVLGSINLDVNAQINNYPKRGTTATAKSLSFRPGGKGSNQAVSVARLGGKEAFIGAVGKDSVGAAMLQNLRNNNINPKYIKRVPNANTGTFITMVDKDAGKTMVGTVGANNLLTARHVSSIMKHISAPILLLQMETNPASVRKAIKCAKAKGMYIILDPAPADDYFSGMLPFVNCTTPNLQETKRITGVTVNNLDDARRAAKIIYSKGVNTAIVKMGAKGNMVDNHGRITYVPAEKVHAVDTVGAGDTFAGAMAVYLAKHHQLMDAIRFANHVAAIKVTRPGGQKAIPTLKEIKSSYSPI